MRSGKKGEMMGMQKIDQMDTPFRHFKEEVLLGKLHNVMTCSCFKPFNLGAML